MSKSLKIVVFAIFFSFVSCKINQRQNGLKTGKWIYEDSLMNIVIKSKGRYKNDFETGIWKEYVGGKLISKHKYKDSICLIKEYHNNGKLRAIGISKLITEGKTLHWFLSEEWKFYDSEGVLLGTKIYDKGTPIQETYTE